MADGPVDGEPNRRSTSCWAQACLRRATCWVDESVRLRLASLLPDDVIVMEFLRQNGNPARNDDWQSVTQGSPGQRTAAMLAFVLHHGHEPLVLSQPEDDLDSDWITKLVVKELRRSRWHRQLIIVSHNANIPVLGGKDPRPGDCLGEPRRRSLSVDQQTRLRLMGARRECHTSAQSRTRMFATTFKPSWKVAFLLSFDASRDTTTRRGLLEATNSSADVWCHSPGSPIAAIGVPDSNDRELGVTIRLT